MNPRRKQRRKKKKALHNRIKRKESWNVWDTVPLFQTLPIIVTPATALASFKTATNAYLQNKHQKDDHNQERNMLSEKQEQTKNPELIAHL